MIQRRHIGYIIGISVFLSACGSSSGDSPETTQGPPPLSTEEGLFFDSPVKGLNYLSGDTIGRTDAAGRFTYEIHYGITQGVELSIGNLILGSGEGQRFMTPANFVPSNANRMTAEVNLVRFLMALDEDSNPDNGLDVSAVNDQADNFSWRTVNFGDSEFDDQVSLSELLADASSILQRPVTLPSAGTAETHINDTYRCLMSGNYYGEFSGDDTGPLVLGINPADGFIAGVGWSRRQSTGIGIPFGSNPLSRENRLTFVANSDSEFIFTGQVHHFNTITGTWTGNSNDGSFTLSRMADTTDPDVVYRFTGPYLAELPAVGEIPVGAYSVNIYRDRSAQGELVNIIIGTTQVIEMSGQVDNGTLSMTASNGMTLEGSIDLDDELQVSGQWQSPSDIIQSGNFSMNGCVINPADL